jgi:hypothetical protein
MSQGYYSILRLSPWFHMIAQKDSTFIFPINEWLQHPFRFFHGNLLGEIDWLWRYATVSYSLLAIIGFPALISLALFVFWAPENLFIFIPLLVGPPLLLMWKSSKEKLLLYIWMIAPFTGLALFGKVLYPRFIFFMTMPLLITAAWTLNRITGLIKNKLLLTIIYILVFAYPLFFGAKILFSIITAPVPRSDNGQYINDWPSGWGIRESVDILEREARDKKITLFTEGSFGLLPYGIEIYLVDNPNIEIIGIWPIPEVYTPEMKEKIAEKPVYYISNKFQELEPKWNAELIEKFRKGNGPTYLRLYKLKPMKVQKIKQNNAQ